MNKSNSLIFVDENFEDAENFDDDNKITINIVKENYSKNNLKPSETRKKRYQKIKFEEKENLNDEFFKLNIGGKRYIFRSENILDCREPNSLLEILVRANHTKRLLFVNGYCEVTSEYYLERNAKIAEVVMDYFLTGKLHKPYDICVERFREELLFWHLTNVELAPCCSVLADTSKINESLETEFELDQVKYFPKLRKIIFHLMENPSSSIFAKAFTILSIFFIFSSVLGLIMGSMPEFQEDNRYAEFYHLNLQRKGQRPSEYYSVEPSVYRLIPPKTTTQYIPTTTPNGSISFDIITPLDDDNTTIKFVYKATDNPHKYLIYMEYICIAWFSFEYFLRFLVAPRKIKFFKSTVNLIDLFTFLPIFFELGLSLFGINANELKEITGAMLVIRILRVLRMARVFKLARYSTGLQVFGYTLRSSMRELCMLSMFLVTGTIFFSTIMYFLEKDEPNTDFKSIPAACWWCIITVTTVGYGDCLIVTTLGKSVAAIASVFGIIILAFPISMVVENFAFAQQQSKVESQLRETQMSAIANDYLMKRYPSRRKACREPMDIIGPPKLCRRSMSAYHSMPHVTRRGSNLGLTLLY